MFNVGDKVRLAPREVGGKQVPGRGVDRVGKVEKTAPALSGPGGRVEVQNCHVRFPAVKNAKVNLPEIVEIHEAGALEAA